MSSNDFSKLFDIIVTEIEFIFSQLSPHKHCRHDHHEKDDTENEKQRRC